MSSFVAPSKIDLKWLKYGQNIHIASHSFIQIKFIQLLYLFLAYSILDETFPYILMGEGVGSFFFERDKD